MKVHLRLAVAVLMILLFTLTAHAENLSVDCRPGGKGIKTISEAVALIAKKNPLGPNTITVTGQCVENVSIVSLDNLTLQVSRAGASISDTSNGTLDTLSVADSTRFALNGFTINGSVNCTDYSVCRLYGNTIQNSQIGWGLRGSRSQIDSQSDSISNNPGGPGVIVANQSKVVLFGDAVSQNGGAGVVVNNAGFLVLDMPGPRLSATMPDMGSFPMLTARCGLSLRTSLKMAATAFGYRTAQCCALTMWGLSEITSRATAAPV